MPQLNIQGATVFQVHTQYRSRHESRHNTYRKVQLEIMHVRGNGGEAGSPDVSLPPCRLAVASKDLVSIETKQGDLVVTYPRIRK